MYSFDENPLDGYQREAPLASEQSHFSLGFDDLGLQDQLMWGIKACGFEEPTAIQQAAIPVLLGGMNAFGEAQTGSGKTAAYVIPALSKLRNCGSNEVLVLVPTRELAHQVETEFLKIGQHLDLTTTTIIGGASAYRQIELCNRGAQIVVATPGRMLDLLQNRRLQKFSPHFVVLDEADEMLDMGFIEDIKDILKFLPDKKQIALFSATLPKPIMRLVQKEFTEPVHVKTPDSGKRNLDIEEQLYVTKPKEKEAALVRLIQAETPEKAIVFCRTKMETDLTCEKLLKAGFIAQSLHGDMNQASRTQVMKKFKTGHFKLLVATDVAARGLDVQDLSHVFNFAIPDNKDRYTHRIGRTGRAGAKGIACTFATPQELKAHFFFRQKKMEDFTICAIPSREEVQAQARQQTLAAIKDVPICDSANDIVANVLAEDEIVEFSLRLVSLLMAKTKITGPNQIGFTREISEDMVRKYPAPKGKSQHRSKGRSSRFPRGSGGGKGSSGSKGPKRFPRKQKRR